MKKIKTIEGQGEKQIRAIQNQKEIKTKKNMLIMIKIFH